LLSNLTTFHLVTHSPIDPLAKGADRFKGLAELRNLALAPMLDEPARYANTTVVFINDVAICLEDILELVHQLQVQGADMACAFDWVVGDNGRQPVFYDSYVARSINGDLFFDVPEYVTWAFATNLFWNEPRSRARFDAHKPFQVFACWNGAVAFTAEPIVQGKIAFRGANQEKGECRQGEPQLFCKDLWFHGYGKIMVVPSISLEYSNEKGEFIKRLKGYTSDWTTAKPEPDDLINWLPPPEQVKCMPTFNNQSWRPWNETLT
jgi:alpha-1,3-mannosyltransferase